MDRRWKNTLFGIIARQRRAMRKSEAAFIMLAAIAGLVAGALTNAQQFISHGLQHLFYGVTINRLSALGSIHHPWRLLALPTGGLVMLIALALRARKRPPIDVVEANALHGGRIPFMDSPYFGQLTPARHVDCTVISSFTSARRNVSEHKVNHLPVMFVALPFGPLVHNRGKGGPESVRDMMAMITGAIEQIGGMAQSRTFKATSPSRKFGCPLT